MLVWLLTPVLLLFGSRRQEEGCEFKGSLNSIVISRPCLKQQQHLICYINVNLKCLKCVCVCACVLEWMYMHHVRAEDCGVRRGHWMSWNSSYRWLCAIIFMLETQLRSSAGAVSAFNS